MTPRRTASRPTTPNTGRDHRGRLLAAALTAAARGWHVFPLRPDAKRPAFPDHTADRCTGADPRCRAGHTGWEQRATTDPDRIRRAWSSTPYGIGVACGPSGLLVIDLDRPKAGDTAPAEWRLTGVRDGSDVLAVLAERAGQPFPADTYVVRTGRGGTHLYYAAPPGAGLGNTAGDRGGLGWLVDTRGHGGYVVAAGSTVDSRPYVALTMQPPAPLPGWLCEALTRPAPVAPVLAASVSADRLPAYARAALAAELAYVMAASKGSRNHTLFGAAANLGQLVAGGTLATELVTTELEQAGARIGLSAAEAAATVRSGLRAGAQRPRVPGRPGRTAA
ncbi:MAG TPA: bifunctional DNA primase/polymerase [Mycobacteriales bacterium]|nr:bifunctional DNA primase/polymerase [Mycobacteriales bacterium]